MAELSVKGLGLSMGILWGAYLFLVGLLAGFGVNISWFNAEMVNALAVVYRGYAATVAGAFIGLVYGFVCAGVSGALIAWLYNKFARQK